MATLRAHNGEHSPRQKTGVRGLLQWMREKLSFFSQVLLRDYAEDDARVTVFAVFNDSLAQAFSEMMAGRLNAG